MKLIARLIVLPAIALMIGLFALPAGAASPASGSAGGSGGNFPVLGPNAFNSLTGVCSYHLSWQWSNPGPAGPTTWTLGTTVSCQENGTTIATTVGLNEGTTRLITCPTGRLTTDATHKLIAAVCGAVLPLGIGQYTVFTHNLITQPGIGTCYRNGNCYLTQPTGGATISWAYLSANQIRVTMLDLIVEN